MQSLSASPLLALFSRSASRPNDYQFEPPMADSMTFVYESRCDLTDLDLDEILPMVN